MNIVARCSVSVYETAAKKNLLKHRNVTSEIADKCATCCACANDNKAVLALRHQ
jgi:hypothetical protein